MKREYQAEQRKERFSLIRKRVKKEKKEESHLLLLLCDFDTHLLLDEETRDTFVSLTRVDRGKDL